MADFYRHYGNSPERLWRTGVPLLDLADMAAHLPPDSATYRAINPDWQWTVQTHLLALAVDALHWLQWSKTKDAGKAGSHPPEPIQRPGMKPTAEIDVVGGESFESFAEADAWYEAHFPGRLGVPKSPQPRDERGRFVKR